MKCTVTKYYFSSTADFCAFNTECLNGATCVDGEKTYSCICAKGYYGDHCEHGKKNFDKNNFFSLTFIQLGNELELVTMAWVLSILVFKLIVLNPAIFCVL